MEFPGGDQEKIMRNFERYLLLALEILRELQASEIFRNEALFFPEFLRVKKTNLEISGSFQKSMTFLPTWNSSSKHQMKNLDFLQQSCFSSKA